MRNFTGLETLRGLLGSLFAVSLLLVSNSIQAESSQGAAIDVVNSYLGSLVTGDVQQINNLVGDTMKQKNRQLVLNPEYYGEFLRKHYAGVAMSVESIHNKGKSIEARVRFDYPTSESTTITFMLGQVEGVWKITDEIF